MKTIMVDIDNTICITKGIDYAHAKPIKKRIQKINDLAKNHYVVYATSRGARSGIDYENITRRQLEKWKCKYHRLIMKKPNYDLFICDRAENARILDL